MITDALLSFFHGLASSIFGWCGSHLPSPPTFWTDMTSAFTSAFNMIPGPVRYFLPFGPVVTAGGVMVSAIVVLGGLRLARRVLSLFTGGGGMA